MTTRKHVALICSHLDFAGGYERIIVATANLFAEKGWPVTLIILAKTAESFYPLNPQIRVIQKPMHFGITPEGNMVTRKIKFFRDLLGLRKMLKNLKASAVITTEYYFSVAAVLCGGKKFASIISWEHTHFGGMKMNLFWTRLFNRAYRKLNTIVCLNRDEEAYFSRFSKTAVIPNFSENRTGTVSALDSKTILSVGSLIPRKGIDLMLLAAKKVLQEHTDWSWKLIGSGDMKKEVEDFIATEKLEKQFILQTPVSSDLDREYFAASIFVLSSRSETLPMVLLEAISFGLPCVSFDCPSGPSSIIDQGENGLLVEKENPAKLAEAVDSLIKNEELRKKMGEKALESAQRFSADKVYKLWERIIINNQ